MSGETVTIEEPTSTIRLVHGFPRITLWCPQGHQVLDAALDSRAGRRLSVGDYSDEWCGTVGCGWSA